MGVRRWPSFSRACRRTPRWKALRLEALRRAGFACAVCGARGRLEVDHIRPVRTHSELAFDPANLQALCASCHTRKTRVEAGHPPPCPKRVAWRAAVADLAARPLERNRDA